ncbi:hypothetical protein [Albimonas pacifica]|uniref:Uncharacterized protein n=1 Tax=Albimonas pacifica TaxID=1114924 RepID=A0A1I3GNF9_9RHOB|nr:hypothetical protein [Albimonas pacifica]SFI25004.1 hypothetical protein SAMN05216258_105258 [Albimonas pacifica]
MIRFLGRKGAPAEAGGAVSVAHTHFYVGATGALPEADLPASGLPVAVEFSDGVVAAGRAIPMAGGRTRLQVEGYRTSRGARIGPKAWILEPTPDDPARFRVRASGD